MAMGFAPLHAIGAHPSRKFMHEFWFGDGDDILMASFLIFLYLAQAAKLKARCSGEAISKSCED